MVERIADAGDADALSGIRECLRTRHSEYVAVGVFSHSSLVRGVKRVGEVTAEVHGEICEVFKYDDIMLVGEAGYALQLFLVEADP